MKVPSVTELAVLCVNASDEALAQMAEEYKRRAIEAQRYADRFRKILKQREKAKRRGVAVAL